jgi:RsiW-degrading membrane proteinase PrsW (M82 family)
MIPDGDSFCGYCGAPKTPTSSKHTEKESTGSTSSSFIGGINDYIGNTHAVNLNWKDLFTDAFKKHSKEEAEEIFICGTKNTTPPLNMVSETWPKPWLYSRIFLCFVITYFLLYICSITFCNFNAVPGLIFIGSLTVPFTTLILFMEVNAFRNISVYDVFKFFLIGGCASLVVTLFLFNLEIVDTNISTTWGAMMVGVIEELGKLLIVYALMYRNADKCNYILCGLLIGACVGAGFAAFESAGYAFRAMLAALTSARSMEELMGNAIDTIYLRGLIAPGGHVAWAAISGAALVIAKEGAPLTNEVLKSRRFWKLFAIPVVLHGVWDAPIFSNLIKIFALIVLAWIVVLILINMGLDQVKQIKKNHEEV